MPSSMQAQPAAQANPFAAARASFGHIIDHLASPEAMASSHSELEDGLRERGLELLRLLLEDHLALRAERESPREVTGSDQQPRPQIRPMQRRLMTSFGAVTVRRLSYGAPGLGSLRPTDAELNLPVESYSHPLRRLVAEQAAVSSFAETVASLSRTTAARLGTRQGEELAWRAAHDFEAFYEQREALSRDEAQRTGAILALSVDGKGVVVLPEALREATRRAAEAGEHKLHTRLSSGEKRNRKRMATVAAVYTVAPFVRTPEQIVRTLGGPSPIELARPRPEHKRVWASLEREPDEVIAAMFDEAERRDPERAKRWVVLVDGNRHQLRLIRREARRRGIEIEIVLDFVHVTEYVWRAAWCVFDSGDTAAEQWVGERLLEILRGRASGVAAGMRRSATRRGLSRRERAAIDDCADYLLDYGKHVRYDAYLVAGLPIASGVIEGACRHVVADRMELTGARWSLEGAEAVLRLRSLRSSGDFDEYWRFHLERELNRNHTSWYADGVIPPASHASVPLDSSPRPRLIRAE